MSSNKFGNEPPVLGARPLQLPLDPPRVADSTASHFIVTGPASSNTVSPSALSPSKPVVEHRDFLEIDPELLRDFLTSSAQSDLPPVVADARINDAGINAEKQLPNLQAESIKRSSRWLLALRFPFYLAARALDLFSLLVLIAVVAAIPLLQFISLGYLLVAGSRLADRRPWRQCLPGLRLAGRVGLFALLTGLLSIPVLIVADLAHSAQLLEPNSGTSARWRIGAFLLTAAWLVHVGWAAMRGGRWWHFLWPAPIQFLKQIWRPSTWQKASDQLYDFVAGLQLPKLWWMGAQATVGALLWLVIPVSMMIIGQRAQAPVAPLIGMVGAIVMAWVMFYLPFLQMQFARIPLVAIGANQGEFEAIAGDLCVPKCFVEAGSSTVEVVWAIIDGKLEGFAVEGESTSGDAVAITTNNRTVVAGIRSGVGQRRAAEHDIEVSRPDP